MRIKPKEIDFDIIPAKTIDKLDRFKTANTIKDIIISSNESLVISVYGDWGCGKTFFTYMVRDCLRDSKIKAVIFNAWENDFYKDPFPAIITEISTLFPKTDVAVQQLKKVGVSLLKSGIPQIVKLATAGLLDLKGITEEIISSAATEYLCAKFEEYSQSKEDIKAFKTKLCELLESESENKKIVIIIDELDRCRPSFAIEVLEIIKHLFCVDGLYFILSIDNNQLGASIKKQYGEGIDVDGYLRRFIDLVVKLPEPNRKEYCKYLFERYEYSDFFTERQKLGIEDKSDLIEALSEISNRVVAYITTIYQIVIPESTSDTECQINKVVASCS